MSHPLPACDLLLKEEKEGLGSLTIINSEDAVGVEGDGVDSLLGDLGRRRGRGRRGRRRGIARQRARSAAECP